MFFQFNCIIIFIFFFFLLPLFPARNLTDRIPKLSASNATWHSFMRFVDAGKGSNVDGISELKSYFRRFGYLPENSTFDDLFDKDLETAISNYQKNLGLSKTGKLDYETMRVIVSPRCGVSDERIKVKTTRRFAYFYGEPRWSRRKPDVLTYAFSPTNMIDYVNFSDVQTAFERAFTRWSAVIPVSFREISEYSSADVKIGWYKGDHGDGEAFDGVLGVLAHAFSPKDGRFHFDAAERWAVDFKTEKSKVAIDLESVATHEIGHILGLAHSVVKEAIMYPSLSPRTTKVELQLDDVEGIQALYGSNPNYKYGSRLESDTSSFGGEMGLEKRRSLVKWTSVVIIVLFLIGL